jgi:hypothetical protein
MLVSGDRHRSALRRYLVSAFLTSREKYLTGFEFCVGKIGLVAVDAKLPLGNPVSGYFSTGGLSGILPTGSLLTPGRAAQVVRTLKMI